MFPSTVTLDSEYLKKVRSPGEINFSGRRGCKKYTYSQRILMIIKRMLG